MKKILSNQLKSLLNLCRPDKYPKKDHSLNKKKNLSNTEDFIIQEYDPYIEGITKQANSSEQSGNYNRLH